MVFAGQSAFDELGMEGRWSSSFLPRFAARLLINVFWLRALPVWLRIECKDVGNFAERYAQSSEAHQVERECNIVGRIVAYIIS